MRNLPIDLGALHFVGIGGIGMSGIAEVLHTLGYTVQGSDLYESANVARIRARGINVKVGHDAGNLGQAQVVIVSSAVKLNNPEVIAAKHRLIPIVRRAEMLGELMRLKWSIAIGGTHGKTTTTSLVAAMLDGAGLDPTVINGGIINAWGTNARLGDGDWLVAEADESDGTFLKLPATVAVVTNIDPEHMEYYGSFNALRQAFDTFVQNIPFYGFAALCVDHPEVQAMVPRVSDRRIITYGFSPQAEVRGINLKSSPKGTCFDVAITDRKMVGERIINNLMLPMVGEHNVQNALAAVTIAMEMQIPENSMRCALAGFEGVKRRFTKTGEVDGITIIDDYGHHPVEIAAALKAARSATAGKVIAVVQPHRYSRLQDLFEDFCKCFNDADCVLVAPVHAAGEEAIEGINGDALINGLRHHGHRSVQALNDPAALPTIIDAIAQSEDLVLCLGAGTITQWANALPNSLIKLRQDCKQVANDVG
ncbi:MAG: UDP-N-acetylmuramate--L-alanine ligase [Rhodospirillaceae bacterium TMED8]|nr:UDP-N-acetylmuramate--L-alanine ligase [Magnetovibrio sp.]OUT52301.1 MAG: UDP-N-acetylmuramate--L-alanine ligase [Rhodospirillaceae bacterium TMED8]|tara:strand:+ start:903 stop:2342 length:1440 start_codon:yes stop_codon:yes gene_type:complete